MTFSSLKELILHGKYPYRFRRGTLGLIVPHSTARKGTIMLTRSTIYIYMSLLEVLMLCGTLHDTSLAMI